MDPKPASSRRAHIDEAIAQARSTRYAALRDFAGLRPAALQWKPAPDRWSVGQCLEHLIASNASYTSLFQSIAEGTYRKTLAERIPLLPRLFGPLVRWSMAPESGVKVKTTQAFEPSESRVSERVVDEFAESVDALVASIAALEHVDLERFVVTSPFASFVCYRLKDAIPVAVVHLERHRLQAVRVTEHEEFPRSTDG